MKKQFHNKLVRDKIPNFLVEKGIRRTYDLVSNKKKILTYLIKKLEEETLEFKEAKSSEELADIIEVVDEIKKLFPDVNTVRENKKKTHGVFSNGIILKETEETILHDFYEEWKTLHTFDEEELEILRERHPKAQISNTIPVEWIKIVDEFLNRFKYKNLSYIGISQTFGQLEVRFHMNEYDSVFADYIAAYRKKLEELIPELYNKYDCNELQREYQYFKGTNFEKF